MTRGSAATLPSRGILEFDAESSRSKLRREQAALERIVGRRSVREDLRDLLTSPAASAKPAPYEIDQFRQQGLDPAKRVAVQASLGARDFLLVHGPPGTGKTTFIAELVTQELRLNPAARIVLASQTHIALDNALMRIREIVPEAAMLRLGRTERLAEDVEPLGSNAQMSQWREEAVQQSRKFIVEFAQRNGIEISGQDVEGLARELERRTERVKDLRSRISLRQSERRALVREIESIDSLAVPLLEAADRIERVTTKGLSKELEAAVQRFIEVGIDAASRLESGGPLATRLLAMEQSLAEWRSDLREQSSQETSARASLAAALSTDAEKPSDELLSVAKERRYKSDPRLSALDAVASDWHERFGVGAEFSGALVARAQVVAATCVGLTGTPGVELIPFDLCIIDEASKATATEALVPLASSRRWVLVGDDRQLPPFVDHALKDVRLLERFNLTPDEIGQTLFSVLAERLPAECRFSLTHQHRMHPTIGNLVSQCFYDGALTSEPRDLSDTIKMAFGAAAVWVDTARRPDRSEVSSGSSYKNKGEARVVTSLLDRLQWVAAQRSDELTVAVLTGYDAQRQEITESLAQGEHQRENLRVKVATVDAYQGQEADVCMFSATRSNNRHGLGFLASEERINVALSRARDGLLVIGDASFIDQQAATRRSPLLTVLEYMRSNPDCLVEESRES
nr:AAA domain-containing protein [Jiangella mangrovi]